MRWFLGFGIGGKGCFTSQFLGFWDVMEKRCHIVLLAKFEEDCRLLSLLVFGGRKRFHVLRSVGFGWKKEKMSHFTVSGFRERCHM